jgi:hypothetical protein
MPCDALLAGAARQMVDDLVRCVPQDLSNSIWAYASLRWNPGEELLNGAALHAVHCMPSFKPQARPPLPAAHW